MPTAMPNRGLDVMKAMIDTVAYVFKAQTDQPGNCMDREVKKNNGKGRVRIYHCQVGERVYFSALGSDDFVEFEAHGLHNSKTKEVTYSCGRPIGEIEWYMEARIAPKLKSIHHILGLLVRRWLSALS